MNSLERYLAEEIETKVDASLTVIPFKGGSGDDSEKLRCGTRKHDCASSDD